MWQHLSFQGFFDVEHHSGNNCKLKSSLGNGEGVIHLFTKVYPRIKTRLLANFNVEEV